MTTEPQLSWGPLINTADVVFFVALSGIAWFNAFELLVTIFLKFRRWSSGYFWCLLVATCGVLCYQLNVFLMIFATSLNMYAIILGIGIGWACMVTGQSLVLWSRLHLVCHSQWKLRAILCMIIIDGICLHVPQVTFSLVGIKHGVEDPEYKPFKILEKISVAVFTLQELIISSIYLYETVRVLRVGEKILKKNNRRRFELLFLTNVAIIAIDVCLVTLEFLALWGIWCSFKGFAYSLKLKIEFTILNQLRDMVAPSANIITSLDENSRGPSLTSRIRDVRKQPRHQFCELQDVGQILGPKMDSVSEQSVSEVTIRNEPVGSARRGSKTPRT